MIEWYSHFFAGDRADAAAPFTLFSHSGHALVLQPIEVNEETIFNYLLLVAIIKGSVPLL